MRAELGVYFGLVVVLFGGIVSALQFRGVIHMIPARMCLIVTWLLALALVGISEPMASKGWTHILVAEMLTAVVCGAILILVDRLASRHLERDDQKQHPERDLRDLLAEGDVLLNQAADGRVPGLSKRLARWESTVGEQLSPNTRLQFLSNDDMETFTSPNDYTRVPRHQRPDADFLNRIYTRIVRLKTLLRDASDALDR